MTDPDTGSTASDRPAGLSDDDRAQLSALAEGRLDRDEARQVRARLASDRELLTAFGELRIRQPSPDLTGLDTRTGAGNPSRSSGQGGLRERLTTGRSIVVFGALVVTVAVMIWISPSSTGSPAAVPDTTPPLVTTTFALGGLWPQIASGPTDLGYLTELDRLQQCWPMGVPEILGARPAIIDGRYGVVVATPDPVQQGDVQLTVLGRDCNALDGGVIAEARVTR